MKRTSIFWRVMAGIALLLIIGGLTTGAFYMGLARGGMFSNVDRASLPAAEEGTAQLPYYNMHEGVYGYGPMGMHSGYYGHMGAFGLFRGLLGFFFTIFVIGMILRLFRVAFFPRWVGPRQYWKHAHHGPYGHPGPKGTGGRPYRYGSWYAGPCCAEDFEDEEAAENAADEKAEEGK